MATYECIVQDGCTTRELRDDVVGALERLDALMFGRDHGFSVSFSEVPRGAGFTAGAPSRTSIVRVRTPLGCDYETRRALMSKICEIWYKRVGCARDELVVFTSDQPFGDTH